MSKGFKAHQERQQALSLLGKPLARRAASKCELCGAAGRSLTIVEVPPTPADPDFDHCLMACDHCATAVANPRKPAPPSLRPLATSVWSEIPAVQVAALRVLRTIAPTTDWAREALEFLDLDPDVEAWADKG